MNKENWEGFSAGEDINCGDMICRKGNLFFRCRVDGKYSTQEKQKWVKEIFKRIDEIKVDEFKGMKSPIAVVVKLRNRIIQKLEEINQ